MKFKFKKIWSGKYTAQNGTYVAKIDRHKGKWYAVLTHEGEPEASWKCKTKKEAVNCVNGYFGE